jgi:hypothetical protein
MIAHQVMNVERHAQVDARVIPSTGDNGLADFTRAGQALIDRNTVEDNRAFERVIADAHRHFGFGDFVICGK